MDQSLEGSAAGQFVTQQGWNWRHATSPNIAIENCPYCQKNNYHFYMEIHGQPDDPQKSRDGLALCMKCGKGGNLFSLKKHLGLVIDGVDSRKDWSQGERKIDPLPDTETCHQALLEDIDALDYLMNGRGFSREIIEQQKIGLTKRYFRETGEVRALVYPYLVNGNSVFAHFRTLPTMPLSENRVVKAFSTPTGWDAPLYNGEILRDGLTEVFMVEGEANCISAMDHGVINICGVPGANFKKAEWIDTLDKLSLEKIYICYDKDKVGQRAAQTLAAKIGIEKCWKITLPNFTVTTEDGTTRPGKDLNEYFTQGGGTAESFEQLKVEAVLFDVDGVSGSKDAVQEFMDELEGKEGLVPKYQTPWPSLNKLVGFEEGDIIDILAPEKIGKTTLALNILEHMVNAYGESGVFICLEMTKARMARKWISHKARIADNMPKTPEEAVALANEFRAAIPRIQEESANRDGDFYFCYPRYKSVDDIYTLMRDCIRRYGVKWIVIDNIQRLADTTPRGTGRNRTEHLSEISKVISQIGKDYGVQIIRILQPNRIGEHSMVTTDNVDGSSQIAKDCDCMMTAHRPRLSNAQETRRSFELGATMEAEESFGRRMLLTVGLSRYSSGGRAELDYDGATSTVSELEDAQRAAIAAMANRGVGHAAQLEAMGIQPEPQARVFREEDEITI